MERVLTKEVVQHPSKEPIVGCKAAEYLYVGYYIFIFIFIILLIKKISFSK